MKRSMGLSSGTAGSGFHAIACMRVMPHAHDSSVARMLRLVRGCIPDCTARLASLHGRENAVPKVDINMH